MPKQAKAKTKTAATKKKPRKKTAKKSSKKTVKPKTTRAINKKITIKTEVASRKSPYVVNLKNPNQDLFEDKIPTVIEKRAQLSKISPNFNTQIKPPKLPKGKKRLGVNLIPTSSKISLKLKPINFKKAFSFKNKGKELMVVKPQKDQNFEDVFDSGIEDIFAKPNSFNFFQLNIPRNWYKRIAVFVVISIIFILPLQAFTYYQSLQGTKDKILLITNDAISNLMQAEKAAADFNFQEANNQFDQAKYNFNLAQKEIDSLNALTGEVIKLLPNQNKTVNAGISLLEAGEIIAETGQILVNSGENFLADKSVKDYYQSLLSFKASLRDVIANFNTIKEKLETIKPSDLPQEHQETFNNVLTMLPTIETGLKNIYSIDEAILRVLGDDQWKRYLLVFLNNNELRGGGGFMGSFGLLDIDRGEIKSLDIPGGGTYDLQGWLKPKVISPQPLHLINPRWEFQDANWWPDFPSSAEKIEWFYENTADNPSVDGVIAITSTLMERLLDIFGPIEMPEYDRVITSENFTIETQKIVELEYDKEENRPKKFISDLAPILIERIFSAQNQQVVELFNTIKQGLNEKQIMVYFDDSKVQEVVSDFGWSSEIKETDGDYLMIVNTNLAGGKTDGVIKENIQHQAEVQEDGSIIDTVRLTRNHTGIAGENIFTGVQNNSYIRFYVPLGSELLEAQGFKIPPEELFEEPSEEYQKDLDLISIETQKIKDESTQTDIYKEKGKTVFGNWSQLKPGEIQFIKIKYRLPFKLALDGQNSYYYSLLAQKQPGSLGSDLKSILILNDNLIPIAKFPNTINIENNQINFNDTLTTDKFYGVVLVNK